MPEFDLQIRDRKSLTLMFNWVLINHVNKMANRVDHSLAKLARHIVNVRIWEHEFPCCVRDIIACVFFGKLASGDICTYNTLIFKWLTDIVFV